MQELTTTLIVNGRKITHTAPGHVTLLRWLRECAAAYDVKYGCGEGVCGACTVLVEGRTVSSCLVPAARLSGRSIQTPAGLVRADGSLNELQQAFLDHGAAQCGFCTGGMLMAATELLGPHSSTARPGHSLNEAAIREALHGNLCRCTGYGPIVAAVEAVARGRLVGR